MEPRVHETWSSSTAFLLAAIGSAVGLGNVWRFTTIAGENGGGAFILIYILCIVLIGVPILVAEISFGRRGGGSPIASMRALARAEGRSPAWHWLGWIGVLTGLIALTYYSVIAGFTLDYVLKAANGIFAGISAERSTTIFADTAHDTWRVILWHTLFMALTVLIVARGVRNGIEKTATVLMPILFFILLILAGYSVFTADFSSAFRFMFAINFSNIDGTTILIALGQVFFSLSIGIGAMMTYGAYLEDHESIPRLAGMIAAADTLVAILAGFAVFPLVFSYGLDPGLGESLVFETLPVAFGQMPGGRIFGTLFFLLLTFAALSTSISMLEPLISYLEEHKGFARSRLALWAGLAITIIGIGPALSLNEWKNFFPLGFIPLFKDYTVLRLLDFVDTNILNVLGGLFIAVFAGWFMGQKSILKALGIGDGPYFRLWHFLIRYIGPTAITIIFVDGIRELLTS